MFLSIFGVGNTFATVYYQSQSGNWNNPNTWTTNGGWGGNGNTGTYPQAGDDVHFANNGNLATITLTDDAQCANLIFDGSEPACVIAMGNYNLIVSGSWTTNWGSNATITQGVGYLQINGGIPQFYVGKTINNFRVGSSSFYFVQSNTTVLTVTTNYDYNCYTSSIPTGIDASAATKSNATPCSPILYVTPLTSFGNVCTSSTLGPNSFTISGLAITNADITVGALNGYTYSTTAGGTYASTLTLHQSGGHYSQVIYVKFSPTTATTYNGNILVSGAGASSVNVAAVGSGAATVIPTVISPTFTNIGLTTATLGGNITVDGCSSQSLTERGIYYSTTYGFPDGAGTKVSETGTFGTGTFTINVTGLSPSTVYYFKAFATNNIGTGYSSQGSFNNTPINYYTHQSGNWTDPTTWSTVGCGNATNTGTYPGSVDNVKICQQHNITVNISGLSCNSIDMSDYLCQLILNNDFTIKGTLTLTNQGIVTVGANNLTINGDYSFVGNNTNISWTNGNLTFGGNVSYSYPGWGYLGLTCSGTGWLIMTGASKTFTANNNVSVPNFRQPTTGFSEAGGGIFTISTVFDQNCGPAAPVGVSISIPGNTINSTCYPNKYFRSKTSGFWDLTSTWEQSIDAGSTWGPALSIPIITDGLVTIQAAHTVTLRANAVASSLTINGSLDLCTYT